uniref:Putative secreted protein n=1 Tax=Anopheles darlingi TaxID=43151 RepID=A0A2M4DL28_ANODA
MKALHQRQRRVPPFETLICCYLAMLTTLATTLAERDICTVTLDAIVPPLPAPCQPLDRRTCDHQLAAKRYEQARAQCRVSAASRRDTRAAFPKQLTNWYNEQTFFLEQLDQLHETNNQRIITMEQQIENGTVLLAQLRRKHFIYCIEAGRTKEALLYHATARQQLKPGEIIEAIRTNKRLCEGTMVALLDFIRALPNEAERRELYRAAKPILGPILLRTDMALVFGIDARAVAVPANETEPVLAPMTERYREDFLDGNDWNHAALTRFARDYPRYYVYLLPAITTITQQQWNRMVKVLSFKLAMGMPTHELRLLTAERAMELVEKFAKRDAKVRDPLLMRFSFSVYRLKKQAEHEGSPKATMDRIERLMKRFNMGQNRQYAFYLKEFEKRYVKEWKRMQEELAKRKS